MEGQEEIDECAEIEQDDDIVARNEEEREDINNDSDVESIEDDEDKRVQHPSWVYGDDDDGDDYDDNSSRGSVPRKFSAADMLAFRTSYKGSMRSGLGQVLINRCYGEEVTGPIQVFDGDEELGSVDAELVLKSSASIGELLPSSARLCRCGINSKRFRIEAGTRVILEAAHEWEEKGLRAKDACFDHFVKQHREEKERVDSGSEDEEDDDDGKEEEEEGETHQQKRKQQEQRCIVIFMFNGRDISENMWEGEGEMKLLNGENTVFAWVENVEMHEWGPKLNFERLQEEGVEFWKKIGDRYDAVSEMSKRTIEKADAAIESANRTAEISDRISEMSKRTIEKSDAIIERANRTAENADRISERSKRTIEKSDAIIDRANRTADISDRISEMSKRTIEKSDAIIERANRITATADRAIEEAGRAAEMLRWFREDIRRMKERLDKLEVQIGEFAKKKNGDNQLNEQKGGEGSTKGQEIVEAHKKTIQE